MLNAIQGPKQTSSSHFWQMVWHETSETAVIVMLTQVAEAGREKCYQYFPLGEEARTFQIQANKERDEALEGHIQLVETSDNQEARTTIRQLVLTVGEEKKIVWHLLFSGWPDFDVPHGEDRAALLELMKLSAFKNEHPKYPRIIHCSAGVGRSGTFIALEYLLARLESGAVAEAKESEDIIYDTVNRLREQRMTMVQSDVQYNFLYEVLREQFKLWQVNQVSGEGTSTRLVEGIKSALLHVTGQENGHDDEEAQEVWHDARSGNP